MEISLCGVSVSGRRLLDHCDNVARSAYFGFGAEKEEATDVMWYLWCGKNSPLFGRSAMTTFERLFIDDQSTHIEVKNPYYIHILSEENCVRILREFGLENEASHIINGHVPVRKGENPIKANGRLIVIDGGFCRAYQQTTGIAGYTLIFSSQGMRLSAHSPFESVNSAVEKNADIHSSTMLFETHKQRMLVRDADNGRQIAGQIRDLKELLNAYRERVILESR